LALATDSFARVGPRLISTALRDLGDFIDWAMKNFGSTSSKVLRALGAKPISASREMIADP